MEAIIGILAGCGFCLSMAWIAVYEKPNPIVQIDWAGNTKG